jgi:conjugal transfer pilus assembly protein TraV
MRSVISLLSTVALLTGCAIGSPDYSCPAPEHGMCKSISDVYTAKSGSSKSSTLIEGADKSGPQPKTSHDDELLSGASLYTDCDELVSVNCPRKKQNVKIDKKENLQPYFATYPLATLKPGDPLRREARVIRIWIAPWVEKGDYFDQSYVYSEIDRGQWLLKHQLRAIQRQAIPAKEK